MNSFPITSIAIPFYLLCFLASFSISAHESLETNSHQEVLQKSLELGTKFGNRNVLVVLDIDNTLLKARQPLGSDQWFEWQAEAIKNNSQEAIFQTFDALMEAQADFFHLGRMSLTETALPQIVEKIKSMGHPIILLTSRNVAFRNATERELLKNKLWFSNGSFMNGKSFETIEPPFKSKVTFMNGIFMTSGHHKGDALAYILKRAGKNYKAIIFADDNDKHTKRVYDTLSVKNESEIVTFRYSKEDETVQKFRSSSKAQVNKVALDLMKHYQSVFKR